LLEEVYDKILALNKFRLAVAASNEELTYPILVSNEAELINVEEVKLNIEELNKFKLAVAAFKDAVSIKISAIAALLDAVYDNKLALNKFKLAVAASNEELTYLILVSKEALLVRVDDVKFRIEELKLYKLAVVDNMLELNKFRLAVAASNELLTYLILVSNDDELISVEAVKFNTELLKAFIDAVVVNIEALNAFTEAVNEFIDAVEELNEELK
jgi:hypothetical protein